MADVLVHALAGGSSLSLCAGIVWFTIRGPHLRERLWTRAAERHVTRTQSRRRRHIEHGTDSRRTLRALHNDFDPTCIHAWGDRNPEANDTTNRDFGGEATSIFELRCIVCRPYTGDEDQTLLDPDATADARPSTLPSPTRRLTTRMRMP